MAHAVPQGYKHQWKYTGRWNEKKIGQGKWRVKFTATKRTKSGRGGPKRGFKIHWGFRNMNQIATKTRPGRYQTVLTGEKYVKHAGYGNKFAREHKRYKNRY